ncbi:MAG: hypothetical protein H0T42_34640 [Deltaproteobacteria bacterium]|nr:hypothetical protein [Deltaproteobacteria bacterium]
MQYFVRNRRRLRPTTGEHVRATTAQQPPVDEQPTTIAQGSGLHKRPLVTEINLTRPFQGRLR